MSGISTGVGLISGINTADLISKLMAIEAQPVKLLQQRVTDTTNRQTAFMKVAALLTAAKGASASFDEASFFRTTKATSSNSDVVTATTTDTAVPGSYTFRVRSIASAHQLISRGMPDKDRTPVGAGTLTIELGKGALNPTTSLKVLNQGEGVHRGTIRITDRSGKAADIDLSAAFTVNDVLQAINSRSDVSVKAEVRNDHFVITDVSGGGGRFTIADLGGGQTAADLGIAASVSDSQVAGSSVFRLGAASSLSVLNDGNGVRRNGVGDDFSITTRDGHTINVNLADRLDPTMRLERLNSGNGVRLGTIKLTNRAGKSGTIDLSGARTMEDVLDAINAAVDDTGTSLRLNASTVNSKITITDSSLGAGPKAASNLIIEDVTGFAARDLGIAVNAAASTVTGSSIYRVSTVGDVLRAINYASGNDGRIQASLAADGARIVLTDTTAGGAQTQVATLNDSKSAYDLGILDAGTGQTASNRIVAGLNTVLLKSLNGGSGVGLGTIEVTAGDGTTTDIDLRGAETVQDLLDAINTTTETSKVRAELSDSSLGIVIEDVSGGSQAMTISDLYGTTAADLHIASSGSLQVDSGNLQLQYISETTQLSQLNAGKGVSYGKFTIINSRGSERTIELKSDTDRTVGDVIKRINSQIGLDVVAKINATGDGILLEDQAGGAASLQVSESGGTTAADLNILGTADPGHKTVDGSFEIQLTIGAGDTLQDVANKINQVAGSVAASLINDGSGGDSYRLSLLSKVSGTAGQILIDSGTSGLAFDTLVDPQDAVVFFGGGANSATAMPIVSSTNTISNFIDGVTLNLTGTSSGPVTVTVDRDADRIVQSVQTFIKRFNDVIDQINALTKYDQTTDTRGLLLGDGTIEMVRQRLYGMVNTTVAGADAGFARLSSVGVNVGDGAKLELDETRLRDALANNPSSVEKLFTLQKKDGETTQNLGIGYRIQQVLDDLTTDNTGLLARQEQQLDDRVTLFNDRIADMNALLAKKQARLEAQFQAMEASLAQLQTQQTALASLSSIDWSTSTLA
jgi:flagellar hook-associated protein 2